MPRSKQRANSARQARLPPAEGGAEDLTSQATNLLRRENWTKSGPVVSHLPGEEIESLEERAAATIADPTSLGLWGFATGTWVIGTVLAGVFPASALTATIPVLVVFAGLAQFIAGLFAYRRASGAGLRSSRSRY